VLSIFETGSQELFVWFTYICEEPEYVWFYATEEEYVLSSGRKYALKKSNIRK
jgi:hypothetical protein